MSAVSIVSFGNVTTSEGHRGQRADNAVIRYSLRGAVPVRTTIKVSTPEGGIYMEDVYPNSGKVVARKLVAALTPYSSLR